MAKKMPGRLVALSASAVATIYIAGLVSTQSAAQGAPLAEPTLAATASASASPTPEVVVGASATPTASATTAYADGTYSATGTSALGNVTVSVTVTGGTISNVQITKVTTKYPVSRIASLPAQVVKSQTANVSVMSGATYSSQAFKQAVQAALAQAQAAQSASPTA